MASESKAGLVGSRRVTSGPVLEAQGSPYCTLEKVGTFLKYPHEKIRYTDADVSTADISTKLINLLAAF